MFRIAGEKELNVESLVPGLLYFASGLRTLDFTFSEPQLISYYNIEERVHRLSELKLFFTIQKT